MTINMNSDLFNQIVDEKANELITSIDNDVEYWLLTKCGSWTGIILDDAKAFSYDIMMQYKNWLNENCEGEYRIYGFNQIAFESSKDASFFALRWL